MRKSERQFLKDNYIEILRAGQTLLGETYESIAKGTKTSKQNVSDVLNDEGSINSIRKITDYLGISYDKIFQGYFLERLRELKKEELLEG